MRPEDNQSTNARDLYRLSARPLGEGSYAIVFRATHRETGDVVALKRARDFPMARHRIEREIQAQMELAHPNIMPIRDHDPGFQWYTMPIAEGTIIGLRESLDEEILASIVLNLADALEVAHNQKLVHRDISPNNILALPTSGTGSHRWVVADWGMVRRPPTSSLPALTRTGQGMGTPGFDSPEIITDPRNVTAASDIYSLGRVAAWFLTQEWPRPLVSLLPDGNMLHWRAFVRACTELDVSSRINSMRDLREMLRAVFEDRDEPVEQRARNLIESLLMGNRENLDLLMSLADTYPDEPDLYLDHVARIPTAQLRVWIQKFPERAARLGDAMCRHLVDSPWKDRDVQYVATPLGFVHAILDALVENGRLGQAQDLAGQFFTADARWAYLPQRSRTMDWLTDLDEVAVRLIARALASRPDAVAYYRQAGWRPKSAVLAAILSG